MTANLSEHSPKSQTARGSWFQPMGQRFTVVNLSRRLLSTFCYFNWLKVMFNTDRFFFYSHTTSVSVNSLQSEYQVSKWVCYKDSITESYKPSMLNYYEEPAFKDSVCSLSFWHSPSCAGLQKLKQKICRFSWILTTKGQDQSMSKFGFIRKSFLVCTWLWSSYITTQSFLCVCLNPILFLLVIMGNAHSKEPIQP